MKFFLSILFVTSFIFNFTVGQTQKYFWVENDPTLPGYKRLIEVQDQPWIALKANVVNLVTYFTNSTSMNPTGLDTQQTRLSFYDMVDVWENEEAQYQFNIKGWAYQQVGVGFSNDPATFGSFVDIASGATAMPVEKVSDYPLEYRFVAGYTEHPITRQVQAQILFNSSQEYLLGHKWILNSTILPPPTGKIYTYFPKVALHELGHVLGLFHNDQSGSVMYDDGYPDLYNTELAWYEIQAIFYLYLYYSPIVSVGDFINLTVDHDIFEVGTTHVGCIHPNFVCVCGEIPPCTMNEYDMEVFALSDCGEVLIYEGSTVFTFPTLPAGYRWIRDENDDVVARIKVSGTDSRGAFHEASHDIKIHGAADQFITSGTLTDDTHWCGEVDITGNITVPAGKTLTIHPGAHINFNNNSSLIVNGNLIIESQPIGKTTLDFIAENSTVQNGIKINPGGTANINLAIIKNGYYGVYVNETDLDISETEIHHCYTGVHLYRTNYSGDQGVIKKCNLHDNDFGVVTYYSSPLIYENTIYNNWRGIGCADYSSPSLGNYDYFGNNQIYSNDIGVFAYGYSNPFLGRYSCTVQGGYNSIYSNTYKDVYLNTYSSSIAENNWWGSSTPQSSQFYVAPNCSFDYNPWLTSVPESKLSLNENQSPEEVIYNEDISTGVISAQKEDEKGTVISYNPDWPLEWKLLYARNLLEVKKYKFAQKVCKNIIKDYPDSIKTYYALDLLWKACRRNGEHDTLINFINSISGKNHNKNLLSAMELIKLGYEKFDRIKEANKLSKKYKGEPIVEFILFHKFLYYFNEENDITLANEVAIELASLFPDSESTLAALGMLGLSTSPKTNIISDISDTEQPSEFKLLGNYPNPFNPSTNIKFAIPDQSEVELIIYDIMGNSIKYLFHSNLNSGYHEVSWDGTNNHGQIVSSGIYFYKILVRSGNNSVITKTSKLLLIK